MPVEGEEPGEEEHGGVHLTPRADPAAAQAQRQGPPGGAAGWVVLIRAGAMRLQAGQGGGHGAGRDKGKG